MRPRKSCSQKLPICSTSRPLRMVVTRRAPSIVPTTATTPPERSVPPSTGPRNEGSSHSSPPDRGHGRPEARDHHQPGGRGEQPGERVADDDDAADRHARHRGGAGVGAGGEDLPAEDRVAVEDEERRADEDGDDEERRDGSAALTLMRSLPKAPTSGGSALSGTALVRISMAPREEVGARQRNDEAVDAGLDDREAVEPAEQRAERQRAEDGKRDRQRRASCIR